MKLFPFVRIELVTEHSVGEALELLAQNLEPRQPWKLFREPYGSGFEGVVYEHGAFRLHRVISGRDSFRPFVFGRIEPDNAGARIRAFATFHPGVIIVMLWFHYMLGFDLSARIIAGLGQGSFGPATYVPLACLLAFDVFGMVSFSREVGRLNTFLAQIFAERAGSGTLRCR